MDQNPEPLTAGAPAQTSPPVKSGPDLFFLWVALGFGMAALLIIGLMWHGYSYGYLSMKANKALAAGQYDAEIPYLERMLARVPSDWQHQRLLGDALMNESHPQPRKALEHYRLALQYNPDLLFMNETLGVCYSELGNQQKANEYFSKLAAEKPDNPAMNYYLGVQYFNAKHYREASRCFQAASADPKWDLKAEPYRRQLAQIVLGAPVIAPPTATKPRKNG